MSTKESTSNFFPALSSLLVAGTGQLFQGRKLMALVQFALWVTLWFFFAGWTVTIWSVIDAIIYSG